MSFKKIASKSIALALVGVTVGTPMLKTVSAMENTKNNEVVHNLDELEDVNFDEIRQKFENISGKSRSNIVEINEENYQAIINTNTGDITHTYIDVNGEFVSYTTNYYENIEQFSNIEFSIDKERSSVVDSGSTFGPTDALYYKVTRNGSKYSINIKNSKGKSAKYTKTGSYYNGNTKNFINAVDNADLYVSKLAGSIGSTALVSIVGFIGLTGGPVSISVVKAALSALGLGSLFSVVTSITDKYNDYKYWVKQSDRYYNLIV